MTIRNRLRRVEVAIRHAPAPGRPEPVTPEDWLAQFEAWDREGMCSSEPDFPEALARYRDALARARAAAGPAVELPPEWSHHGTSAAWQVGAGDPEVEAAFTWLLELSGRAVHGVPPVTAAEFQALGDWFEANAERMERQALPARWFDLGAGRLISTANIRHGLGKGPRALGAGELRATFVD